jgi:pyridoxamine 5'-phosphate oxidase
LHADPLVQFEEWFDAARAAGLKEPTAMTLATTTRDGRPSARMVLLKSADRRGFGFFTNYESRKGRELAENPRAALVLYWAQLDRQVRITGTVSKMSADESDAYFHSRPAGSRFSAAASRQSEVIESREILEHALAELRVRYPEGAPPRPESWGGYIVEPEEIEFWQQGEYRLHDRIRYRRAGDGWIRERLSP